MFAQISLKIALTVVTLHFFFSFFVVLRLFRSPRDNTGNRHDRARAAPTAPRRRPRRQPATRHRPRPRPRAVKSPTAAE